MASQVGKVVWIGRALSWLASLLFLYSAYLKFQGGKEVVESMAHLGLSEDLIHPLGILELTCVAVYLLPLTSMLGAILLTGYVGGALCSSLRVGDPYYPHIILGVVIWLGLWLRDARLTALIPMRTRAS